MVTGQPVSREGYRLPEETIVHQIRRRIGRGIVGVGKAILSFLARVGNENPGLCEEMSRGRWHV
jgi:hypothetical protein